jgi:hypothetical protein
MSDIATPAVIVYADGSTPTVDADGIPILEDRSGK